MSFLKVIDGFTYTNVLEYSSGEVKEVNKCFATTIVNYKYSSGQYTYIHKENDTDWSGSLARIRKYPRMAVVEDNRGETLLKAYDGKITTAKSPTETLAYYDGDDVGGLAAAYAFMFFIKKAPSELFTAPNKAPSKSSPTPTDSLNINEAVLFVLIVIILYILYKAYEYLYLMPLIITGITAVICAVLIIIGLFNGKKYVEKNELLYSAFGCAVVFPFVDMLFLWLHRGDHQLDGFISHGCAILMMAMICVTNTIRNSQKPLKKAGLQSAAADLQNKKIFKVEIR